jgi:hypothetical protein
MTNNRKLTAVEWLRQTLRHTSVSIFSGDIADQAKNLEQVFRQAKEMEKERMIDFANNCIKQIEVSDTCELLMVESPKDLYEQTYGGGE